MEGKNIEIEVVTKDWGYELRMTSDERLHLIQIIRVAQGKRTTELNLTEFCAANRALDALGVKP